MKKIIFAINLLITLSWCCYGQPSIKKSITKYAVVEIYIVEGELHYYDKDLAAYKHINKEKDYYYLPIGHTYVSNVLKIVNYNEEEEYKLRDSYRDKMEDKLSLQTKWYPSIEEQKQNAPHIVTLTVKTFKTYKEASLFRSGDSI